jgi:hypothetical protein
MLIEWSNAMREERFVVSYPQLTRFLSDRGKSESRVYRALNAQKINSV